VVQGDVRDDGEFGPDDIRGIEPAAHTDLEDGHVHPVAGKMKKGQGRRELEVGHPFTVRPAHLTDAPAEDLLGDHGPVHPDTLPEIDEVGRRVEPGPAPGDPQDGGEDVQRLEPRDDDRQPIAFRERLEEALFMELRLADGVGLRRIRDVYGVDPWREWGSRLARFVDAGLLEHAGDRLRLTRDGMLLANEVMSTFLEAGSTVK